jgi:hypothetical protein
LLIDTAGQLIELIGGSFSISANRKYFFSIWDSDLSGITVYDLINGNIILSKEIEGDQRYRDIFFQDGKYYLSYDDDLLVGQINFESRKIITTKQTNGFLKKENKLKIYNDVQILTKCNCGRK